MRHVIAAMLIALAPAVVLGEGLAIMPVKLLDTSAEVSDQRAEHEKRLLLLANALQDGLDGAMLIDPETVARCQPETSACLLELARETGADHALFLVVQKTSTLILQIFSSLVDTETGTLIVSRNLNFRGDNDESWNRAGRFLARQIRDAEN